MLPLSATDTIQAGAGAAGMTYIWDEDQVVAGVHTFNPTPVNGSIATPGPAVIWSAFGQQVLLRFRCYNSGAGSTQVTLYRNGSTDVETTFNVPAGGTATWDGIEPRVFNAAGTRQ